VRIVGKRRRRRRLNKIAMIQLKHGGTFFGSNVDSVYDSGYKKKAGE
jgi:hypothetical protein